MPFTQRIRGYPWFQAEFWLPDRCPPGLNSGLAFYSIPNGENVQSPTSFVSSTYFRRWNFNEFPLASRYIHRYYGNTLAMDTSCLPLRSVSARFPLWELWLKASAYSRSSRGRFESLSSHIRRDYHRFGWFCWNKAILWKSNAPGGYFFLLNLPFYYIVSSAYLTISAGMVSWEVEVTGSSPRHCSLQCQTLSYPKALPHSWRC